ncbi:TetR/AcrR family transcriptional regulator [Citricoccus sp. NR2]|uniref:TetR/AcrR family transcriptional regulator n=1 Tax=Citricoccus sp. NR2 TaxID=3004095 RepID=UPI0022DE009C|nr:TetR/AcrR family transcriptional regulator [Citricoccus sp. NR2]WBL17935.1 TetR/AcrR family transcriptional regulator [Citricoccus sp. NR2]
MPPTTRLPRAQRRRQLMDISLRVFAEKGYHAASMDDIAEAADVSKPVLYQHFTGKYELFLTLLDEQLAVVRDAMVSAMAEAETNEERVRGAVRTLFEYMAREDGAHRIVFNSGLGNDTEVRQRVDQFNDALIGQISEHVFNETYLDDEQAKVIGHAMAGTVLTAARYWASRRRSGEEFPSLHIDQVTEHTFQLLWQGIWTFQ